MGWAAFYSSIQSHWLGNLMEHQLMVIWNPRLLKYGGTHAFVGIRIGYLLRYLFQHTNDWVGSLRAYQIYR